MNETTRGSMVLVVDDEADSLTFMNEALSAAGYTVLVAMDGDQALVIAERMQPDLILLDAIMPGKTGFELCELLKASPDLEPIPVIFLTGLSASDDVVRGLSCGGGDFLSKPINLEVMLARVRVHLANARKAQSARKALDDIGQPAFSCSQQGELRWVTSSVLRGLSDRGLEETDLDAALATKAFVDWLRRGPQRHASYRLPVGEQELTVKLLGHPAPDECLLRLVQQDETSQLMVLRHTFSVTDREAEVLFWLSRGKTNQEIAQILSVSPRTVNKHLEPIFRKLGVENRTAAVAQALQVLSEQ